MYKHMQCTTCMIIIVFRQMAKLEITKSIERGQKLLYALTMPWYISATELYSTIITGPVF